MNSFYTLHLDRFFSRNVLVYRNMRKDLNSLLYMEIGYYKWNDISKEEKTIVFGFGDKRLMIWVGKTSDKKSFC